MSNFGCYTFKPLCHITFLLAVAIRYSNQTKSIIYFKRHGDHTENGNDIVLLYPTLFIYLFIYLFTYLLFISLFIYWVLL